MHFQLRKLKSFVGLAEIEPDLETEVDNLKRFHKPVSCVL
jgi:hypothetical protein